MWVHDIFQERMQYGQFHTLLQQARLHDREFLQVSFSSLNLDGFCVKSWKQETGGHLGGMCPHLSQNCM